MENAKTRKSENAKKDGKGMDHKEARKAGKDRTGSPGFLAFS
jgi:hypothetical protein